MSDGSGSIDRAMKEKNIVPEDDEIVFHERQMRIVSLFFPSRVIVTSDQIIKYTPSWIGHSTETRPINRVNDVDVDTGLLTDSISIQSRELDNFVVSGIPKNTGNKLRNELHRLKDE